MSKSRSTASTWVQPLEARLLMSTVHPSPTFVYVESNNPNEGQNAVLAYKTDPQTGALSPLPFNRFLTGGTGYRNAGAALGPDDSDKEVIASPDGRFLFAVNQGSNTVSAFSVEPDGSLSLLPSAPVSSGGVEPVSLSWNNDRLYVLNRGNGAEGTKATVAPKLTAFFVGEDGALITDPAATQNLPLGLSPSQVLTTADDRFEFVDDFATPSNLNVSLANKIEPFLVNADGSLHAEPGDAGGLPANPPLVLGLVEDPVNHLLYSGRAPVGGVSTFSYNDVTGQVKYIGATSSPGAATCWLNISPNGKYLYATDSASDALSVYSLANPTVPKLIQEFYLNGPTHGPDTSGSAGPTSQDFQFSFDPSGQHLYVLNHTVDDAFQQGNQLHTLNVAANGLLSEPSTSPLFFPTQFVPGTAHVLGVAVVTPPEGNVLPPSWSWAGKPTGPISPFSDASRLEDWLDQLFAS